MATWPSGKAEVCKTFIPSSNLGVASITKPLYQLKILVQGIFNFLIRFLNFQNNTVFSKYVALFPVKKVLKKVLKNQKLQIYCKSATALGL